MPLNPQSASTNLSISPNDTLMERNHQLIWRRSMKLKQFPKFRVVLLGENEHEANMAHQIKGWATPSSRTLLDEPGVWVQLGLGPTRPSKPSPNRLMPCPSFLNLLHYCALGLNALFSEYTLTVLRYQNSCYLHQIPIKLDCFWAL